MNWSATGAGALALAVIFGAFGAHGLSARFDASSRSVYETAVLYHFFHALGVLIVSLMPKSGYVSQSQAAWVCGLLASGIVLFSGSLYALAITRVTILGAITPIGGVLFIAGWLLLAWVLLLRQA
jgi:uncharacterized membrane protein YgdD (TMEM256/DUF423 family)